MIYISAQPDNDYYIWQLEVQMNNFKKFGIEKNAIILLGTELNNGPSENALLFKEKTEAQVFFYEDNRSPEFKRYIPSIRPHIIKKFLRENPDLLVNQNVLYHDSDIIFTKKLNTIKVPKNTVLLADTVSYIGSSYIISKSEELLTRMCETVGINKDIVIKNENKSGGAQYLFSKNIFTNSGFWEKIEYNSVDLYQLMIETSNLYSPSHPIQAWTADMWSVLWNTWQFGYKTKIIPDLNFSWATSPISEWDLYAIYHNAGATLDRKEIFFKGNYITENPYKLDLTKLSDKFCSYKYAEEIIETGKTLNLIK